MQQCTLLLYAIFLQAEDDITGMSSSVDYPELCEKCNEKKYAVENEEEDAVGPTQVELGERNDEKRQDQRQTQSSR